MQEPTPSPMRRLIVMRHARAQQDGPTDLERELTPAGAADAAEAGRWLAAQAVTPDAALVSAATRTRDTWQAVSVAAGWSVEPMLDRGLYTAAPETALDLIRMLDDDAATVMVIGHNPTIASVANLLDDGEGDPEATMQMVLEYPACALTIFTYAGTWLDLDWGTARVLAHHVGCG